MTNEVEAAHWLYQFGEWIVRSLFGLSALILGVFTRRVLRDVEENKNDIEDNKDALADYKFFVARTYLHNDDYNRDMGEIKDDIKTIVGDVKTLLRHK